MKSFRIKKISGFILLVFVVLSVIMIGNSFAQSGSNTDGKIAFLRNNDVWMMNADGTDQKPWVAGIANAKGRICWSPDNKKLVFTRQGKIDIKYPGGGGGYHNLYDLFYAYVDSIGSFDNFYMGFTNNLGSQSPHWAAKGDLITFIYDRRANEVDATMMEYTVGFYNLKTKKIHFLDLPKDTLEFMALTPTLSPDGSQVCFVLTKLEKMQLKKLGMIICSSDKLGMTSQEMLTMAGKTGKVNSPTWSPDGKKIAYLADNGLYYCDNNLDNIKLVTQPEEGLWFTGTPTWSPKSDKLAFSTSNGAIYTVNIDGSNMKRISGPGTDINPAWSR